MLLFEFFPAVVAIISIVVGIALYRADRRGRRQGLNDHLPMGSRPDILPGETPEKPGRGRPAMRG